MANIRSLTAKCLLVLIGIVAVWNRWIYREIIDGATLAARLAAGDNSRETLFRLYARRVDMPAKPRSVSAGAGGSRRGGDVDVDEPFHIAELVPPVVYEAVGAALNGLLAQLPKSVSDVQLEDWQRRRSDFSVERTSCGDEAKAGSMAFSRQVAKGANVTVEVHAVYGDDGARLFPTATTKDHPQRVSLQFMEGDVVYGVDKGLEAAFARAPESGVPAGCHVVVRFGSDNGFGARGYWKWRVLPFEPLLVDFAIVEAPGAVAVTPGSA